jgi:hypothetical protein
MRIKIMLFLIVAMVSLQATTYGMGIGVSPGNMSFRLAPGTSAEQPLYVINTGNETVNYSVFIEGSPYQNWFTFFPPSFSLKTGEQMEVEVTLKVPATAKENTSTDCKIKVPCTVPGKIVGTGIMIPVHLEISPLEKNASENISSGNSTFSKIGLKDIQEFFKNNDITKLNFTQNFISIKDTIQNYAENLGEIATKSLSDAARSLQGTNNSAEEENSSTLTGVKGYQEKLPSLPDFNISLTGASLLISGLLLRKRLLK